MARSSARGGRGRGRDNGNDSCRTRTTGQLNSDAYEAPSQHESSDDEELAVGRRGPVAPTPLPEPRNREWIWIRHDQFSNQDKATRTIGEILQAMWCHPWKSWKDVSKEDGDRMFERFKKYYQWESEWEEQVQTCWEKFMKRKFKDLLNRARESAKAAAIKSGVEVGSDLSVITPYKPRWMRAEFWEPLVQSWNTPEWKAKSSQNTANRAKLTGGKHTLGSQTYVTLKLKADEATEEFEDINLQENVEWVDARAKESFKSYQKYVMEKYGDNTSKHPLFDLDTWVQASKKKGRLFDISDPQVMITGTQSTSGTSTYLPARNEEVQQLNEKIAQLQEEKETERQEKEKEKAEKLAMREQIEENRAANNAIRETNAEMKRQIEFLLKNITKK
ncbi:hypothetical protein R6Q59_029162 [Mikania micrantha]